MRQALSIIAHSIVSKASELQEKPADANGTDAYPVGGISQVPEEVNSPPPPPKKSTRWQNLTRFLSMSFAFLSMCLFAAATRHVNDNYINVNGNGDWTDGFALVAPLLSLFIDPIIIVRNLFKSRTTHHTLRISISSVIFALALSSLVTAILGGIFWYWRDAIKMDDGTVDCLNPFNAFTYDCQPVAYTIGHEQIAGSVFLALVALCHLGLTATAVVDAAHGRRDTQQKRLTRSFEMQFPAGKDIDEERGGSRGTESS